MEQSKRIDQKYIDMVERFQAVPNTRKNNVARVKMILKFCHWYNQNEGTLNDEEKEFLQNNIYKIKDTEFYVTHV